MNHFANLLSVSLLLNVFETGSLHVSLAVLELCVDQAGLELEEMCHHIQGLAIFLCVKYKILLAQMY